MKHQTAMTGWPSGNILDFRANQTAGGLGFESRWGKRNLFVYFVYIYRRYIINALLLYIEFLCVLLIMISSIIIIAQRRSTVDR